MGVRALVRRGRIHGQRHDEAAAGQHAVVEGNMRDAHGGLQAGGPRRGDGALRAVWREIEQRGDEHVAGHAAHRVQMHMHAVVASAFVPPIGGLPGLATHDHTDDDRKQHAADYHQALRADRVQQAMKCAVELEVFMGVGHRARGRERDEDGEAFHHGVVLQYGFEDSVIDFGAQAQRGTRNTALRRHARAGGHPGSRSRH